jgi:anti-sigma-K factor RskA
MQLGHHPDLLDRLAASYALGTLKGPARRRFEAYARQSATVRASVLLWQERMGAMHELAAPVQPSPNVWKRIENTITLELEAARHAQQAHQQSSLLQTALDTLRKTLGLWRGAAMAGAVATVAAITVGVQSSRSLDAQVGQLSAQLQASQQMQYVAVLSDAASAATMLVTFDAGKNSLTIKRVGGYQEASDKSLQLWALPNGGVPQSLGVLGGDKVIRIATAAAQVVTVPMLAISLEPKGGVPSATGPTGPVLFKGALLQTSL